MPPPIILEYHNPAWAAEFASFKANLETVLAGLPIITIEHVGSTAIPDLIAKPVIDVDIEIAAENFPAVKEALLKADFFWIGESGIPGRHAFWQPGSLPTKGFPPPGQRRFNTYVCFSDSLSLRNHRDLKRILTADADLRREYGEHKIWILQEVAATTVEWYCQEKNPIVVKILKKAGWNDADLKIVTKQARWESI